MIQTIKFSNNGLTHAQITTLVTILSADNCPIQNLFIDWNPIYSETFRGGEVPQGTNSLWKPADENKLGPFAQLVQDAKKL